LTSYVKER